MVKSKEVDAKFENSLSEAEKREAFDLVSLRFHNAKTIEANYKETADMLGNVYVQGYDPANVVNKITLVREGSGVGRLPLWEQSLAPPGRSMPRARPSTTSEMAAADCRCTWTDPRRRL